VSGSPKYTQAQVRRTRRAELEASRQAEAERERIQREEAEARAREALRRQKQEQFDLQRGRLQAALEGPNLLVQDRQSLQQQLKFVTEVSGFGELEFQLQVAKARWQMAEEQRLHQQRARRLQAELGYCRQLLEACDHPQRERFDRAGCAAIAERERAVEQALKAQELDPAEALLVQLRSLCDEHLQRVHQPSLAWQRRCEGIQARLREAEISLAGLNQDLLVTRWQPTELEALRQLAEHLGQLLQDGQLDEAEQGLEQFQNARLQLLEKAQECQMMAEQRDLIASSVQQALESMGFFVSDPQAEHPHHPATALLLQARSAAGKALGVSVPWQGEIYYQVEGYAMVSEQRPGGDSTRSCDEAERVLNELHSLLDQVYDVETGEILWEGKDPDRNLRKADELPHGHRHGLRNQAL